MKKDGTLETFLKVAKQEVGTIEGPKDNETKYGAYTKANFQPWCGSFVMWCANQAGIKVPNMVYTPAGAAAYEKDNKWLTVKDDKSGPQPGDIVFFDFPGDGVDRISHVGICLKNMGNGIITTIEGNTAGDTKGDQRNGGMVAKKVRAWNKKNYKKLACAVVGWGRPDFKEASSETEAEESLSNENNLEEEKLIKKTAKKSAKKSGGSAKQSQVM